MEITSGAARISAEDHGSGASDGCLGHAGVTDQRSWHHVVDRLPDHGPHGDSPLPGRLGETSVALVVDQDLKTPLKHEHVLAGW